MNNTAEQMKIHLLKTEIETLEKKILALQAQKESKLNKISKIEHFLSIKGVKKTNSSSEAEDTSSLAEVATTVLEEK